MNKLMDRVIELYETDSIHRKGFRIKEATLGLACANGTSEWGELATAIELCRINGTKSDHEIGQLEFVVEELGDVYAILAHLCVMLNISPEELEAAAIAKINKRFQPGLPRT